MFGEGGILRGSACGVLWNGIIVLYISMEWGCAE